MIDVDVRTLADRVGQEIAASDWRTIAQQDIDRFADATGDHQWIHVDAARAQTESPFKSTVAHGFLTLSLASALLRDALRVTGTRMTLNYGLNRVRFVSPVPSGARVRGRFLVSAVQHGDDWIQATWQATIERDGAEKPACVAEWIVRYFLR